MNDGCSFLSQSVVSYDVSEMRLPDRTMSLTALIFATVRIVLGLPLPDFRVVEPVSFKRLRKSFTVVFLQPLAKNSLTSVYIIFYYYS